MFPGKYVNDTTGITSPIGPNATTVNLPSGPTGLDRVAPRFRGLPPSFWVRRIHDRLPAPGNHGQLERAGYGRAYRDLNSRFAFDIIDLDYNSRELSLWPKCDMKWTLGLRQHVSVFWLTG